jgi:transcription-repair coupling factor (superfamily II helicase)
VERLNMYRRISEAANVEDLAVLRDEMIDRFGPLPDEVQSLFSGVELKLEAEHLRLPRVVFKNERLFLTVPDPEQDPWFFEHLFQPLLGALSELDHRYVLKETASKKLQAIVQDVPDMDVALGIVSALRAGTGTLTPSTVGSA